MATFDYFYLTINNITATRLPHHSQSKRIVLSVPASPSVGGGYFLNVIVVLWLVGQYAHYSQEIMTGGASVDLESVLVLCPCALVSLKATGGGCSGVTVGLFWYSDNGGLLISLVTFEM